MRMTGRITLTGEMRNIQRRRSRDPGYRFNWFWKRLHESVWLSGLQKICYPPSFLFSWLLEQLMISESGGLSVSEWSLWISLHVWTLHARGMFRDLSFLLQNVYWMYSRVYLHWPSSWKTSYMYPIRYSLLMYSWFERKYVDLKVWSFQLVWCVVQ